MNDRRDPKILGEKLLAIASLEGRPEDVTLSAIADRAMLHVPDHKANPSVLEKYGDPVKMHRARIALGMEVELP